MKQETLHFTKVNDNLDLIVNDLRMRQNGLNTEIESQNQELEEQARYIKKFQDDLQECLMLMQQDKKLKAHIIKLHKKYVKNELNKNNKQSDTDVEKEYSNQRSHLEKSVENE